jgi:hypothetical protein
MPVGRATATRAVFWTSDPRRVEPRSMVIVALGLLALLIGQDLVALANRPTR